jgi:hypothetical protein
MEKTHSGIVTPGGETPGKTQFDIGRVLANLVQNDLYFETTMYAIVELLKEAKGVDGLPIVTTEKLMAKAEECAKKIQADQQLIKPNTCGLVLPK